MDKNLALAMTIFGLGMASIGLYFVVLIFQYTFAVNSGPNPPTEVIIHKEELFCNCDVTAGLGWNLVALAFITIGAIVSGTGYARYRLIRRLGM